MQIQNEKDVINIPLTINQSDALPFATQKEAEVYRKALQIILKSQTASWSFTEYFNDTNNCWQIQAYNKKSYRLYDIGRYLGETK